jgi:hypothetical protein
MEEVPQESQRAAVAAMATIVDTHSSREVASYVRGLLGEMRHTRDELGEAVATIKAVNTFLSRETADDSRSVEKERERQELKAEEKRVMKLLTGLHEGIPEAANLHRRSGSSSESLVRKFPFDGGSISLEDRRVRNQSGSVRKPGTEAVSDYRTGSYNVANKIRPIHTQKKQVI